MRISCRVFHGVAFAVMVPKPTMAQWFPAPSLTTGIKSTTSAPTSDTPTTTTPTTAEPTTAAPTTKAPTDAPQECTGCNGDEVCVDGLCIPSAAHSMLDSIAQAVTNNPLATIDSVTSTTFDDLFTCANNDPTNDLKEVQHYLWQGFVEYSQSDVTIELQGGESGIIEVSEVWGNLDSNIMEECEVGCQPKTLAYKLPDMLDVELDIPIMQPCSFVSNFVYYRVLPQICGPHFHMDSELTDALNHALGNLAVSSSFFHASTTSLGLIADQKLIAVNAYLVHQRVVIALAEANGYALDAPEIAKLMNLQDTPRSMTAIEASNYVSNVFRTKPTSEWALELEELDVPDFYTTIVLFFMVSMNVVFPSGQTTDILGGLLDDVADTLNLNGAIQLGPLKDDYLPILNGLVANLNLSAENKFILFRQLAGVLSKFIFSMLWVGYIFEIPLFQDPLTNAIAPEIMPPLVSLFNLITGFEHVDDDFQAFRDLYPGDGHCRGTVPHAKWHEMSANALLDAIYHADCLSAIISGAESNGCAHFSNLDGLDRMTQSQIDAWIQDTFKIPDIPIVKDIIPLIIASPFEFFDPNGDNDIDWPDIETMFFQQKFGNPISNIVYYIESFISMFEKYCIADINCKADQYCNIQKFECASKKQDGFWPCLRDAQCTSGTCADLTFTCGTQCDGDSANCQPNEYCAALRNVCLPLRKKGALCFGMFML